jgi:hypothetical protein
VLAEFDVGVDDAWVVGALTSASLYGAVAASALLFFIGDDIGRKFEMIAAAVLYVWPTTQLNNDVVPAQTLPPKLRGECE